MSNRHLARTLVMQSLYQWDFNHQPVEKLDEIIDYDRGEFAANFNDDGYVKETVDGVISHIVELDGVIEQFAHEWPLASMACIDRNILRLGVYELKYSDKVPSKVAIN